MSDDEILALVDHEFPRGRITVHEILDGQVYFASRRNGQTDRVLLRMRRSLFEEAVALEGKRDA